MEFALYIGWHLLIPQPSSPERGPSTHGQVIRVSRSLWDHPSSAAPLQRAGTLLLKNPGPTQVGPCLPGLINCVTVCGNDRQRNFKTDRNDYYYYSATGAAADHSLGWGLFLRTATDDKTFVRVLIARQPRQWTDKI